MGSRRKQRTCPFRPCPLNRLVLFIEARGRSRDFGWIPHHFVDWRRERFSCAVSPEEDRSYSRLLRKEPGAGFYRLRAKRMHPFLRMHVYCIALFTVHKTREVIWDSKDTGKRYESCFYASLRCVRPRRRCQFVLGVARPSRRDLEGNIRKSNSAGPERGRRGGNVRDFQGGSFRAGMAWPLTNPRQTVRNFHASQF